MARALHLAEKGRYSTDPNPRVGCVIVRNGEVIGEGWHVKAGGDHAEIVALNNAGNIKGATVYVTLEPCSHYGKTPPCALALINSGADRVVAAMSDPNPRVAGSGLKQLKAAGIEVSCGLMQQEARALNPGFIKRMTANRPFVRSKIAMSLDGRTAMASGESRWITSSAARLDVHRMRAASSAILTGINTVLKDDPLLNARVDFDVVQPIRVVLDTQLRMPTTARMAKLPGRSLILTCNNDKARQQALRLNGYEVHTFPPNSEGRLDLHTVMTFLAAQQINEVLVEAGALLNGALLDACLIDELIIFMAPCVLGDRGHGLFHLPNISTMAEKKVFSLVQTRSIGGDLRIMLKPLSEENETLQSYTFASN